jgi:ADP-ribose pyrophosphatase YjhB (NUDIX family)
MDKPLTDFPVKRRWRQQLHPMPSVVAVISRNIDGGTRYLLIKRKKEPYLGKWALVGGKWDFGESLSEATEREVKEETGLSVVFSALRALVNYRLRPEGVTDSGAHFLLFICEVHAPSGEAHEQTEGKVRWFSKHEVDELNAAREVVATDYMLLEQWQNRSRSISYFEAEVIAGGEPHDVKAVVPFEALASRDASEGG